MPGFQFTLVNLGNSFRSNTLWSSHQSPPWPVPGNLGRGTSHQSAVYWALCDTLGCAYRVRLKSVMGVMRGVAYTVVVSWLLEASSGIYIIHFLRAIGYFSMS